MSQKQKKTPPPGKRFALEDVRRLPVTHSLESKAYIDSGTHAGRLFPHALAECFGQLDFVSGIALHVRPKSDLWPVGPEDIHPIHGESQMLSITVAHKDGRVHTWHVNAMCLKDIHPLTQEPTLKPVETALELVRLLGLIWPDEQRKQIQRMQEAAQASLDQAEAGQ